LDEYQMPATCISIEMTESVILKDLPLTARVLTALRDLGVAAALDDFGTGFSSLSYLRKLPLSHLKVDGSLTAMLPGDASACSLTHAIIRMAEALKMSTIAEGVETLEQLRWLRDQGCRIGQGYLFSRPVAADLIQAAIVRIESSTDSEGLALAPAA
jgi:EAL domain-containing protein (putative c-di-GMP-specific phosphodiesterase class I)